MPRKTLVCTSDVLMIIKYLLTIETRWKKKVQWLFNSTSSITVTTFLLSFFIFYFLDQKIITGIRQMFTKLVNF